MIAVRTLDRAVQQIRALVKAHPDRFVDARRHLAARSQQFVDWEDRRCKWYEALIASPCPQDDGAPPYGMVRDGVSRKEHGPTYFRAVDAAECAPWVRTNAWQLRHIKWNTIPDTAQPEPSTVSERAVFISGKAYYPLHGECLASTVEALARKSAIAGVKAPIVGVISIGGFIPPDLHFARIHQFRDVAFGRAGNITLNAKQLMLLAVHEAYSTEGQLFAAESILRSDSAFEARVHEYDYFASLVAKVRSEVPASDELFDILKEVTWALKETMTTPQYLALQAGAAPPTFAGVGRKPKDVTSQRIEFIRQFVDPTTMKPTKTWREIEDAYRSHLSGDSSLEPDDAASHAKLRHAWNYHLKKRAKGSKTREKSEKK